MQLCAHIMGHCMDNCTSFTVLAFSNDSQWLCIYFCWHFTQN